MREPWDVTSWGFATFLLLQTGSEPVQTGCGFSRQVPQPLSTPPGLLRTSGLPLQTGSERVGTGSGFYGQALSFYRQALSFYREAF